MSYLGRAHLSQSVNKYDTSQSLKAHALLRFPEPLPNTFFLLLDFTEDTTVHLVSLPPDTPLAVTVSQILRGLDDLDSFEVYLVRYILESPSVVICWVFSPKLDWGCRFLRREVTEAKCLIHCLMDILSP